MLPLAEMPPEVPEEDSVMTPLRNPLERALEETPSIHDLEATQLVQKIQEMVGRWEIVGSDGRKRPMEYRDILLLVKSRTHLHGYEHALRAAHIPYLSARQGGLLETLEASDITALLEFLVMPFADLKLAQVLKSPIFGCNEEDLIALGCHGEGTWWQRLQSLAQDQEQISKTLLRAYGLLGQWQQKADRLPVHDLLDVIYFEGNVLDSYGQSVPDAMRPGVLSNLHAYLELALNVEGGRYPSLQKFINELALFRQGAMEEAPDEGVSLDGANAIRILTIHGAKGLESPVVWLLDTNSNESRHDTYGVLLDWPPGETRPRHFSMTDAKANRGKEREHYWTTESSLAQRENLNLLYVAMTRAKQILIVSGCAGRSSENAWYGKVEQACAEDEIPPWEILEGGQGKEKAKEAVSLKIPAELRAPMGVGTRNTEVVTEEIEKGIILHSLLEHMAPTRETNVPMDICYKPGLTKEQWESFLVEARAILDAPHLRQFFDPGCYVAAHNELSYLNSRGDLKRIDRLVEFEDAVWILDYKITDAGDEQHLDRRAKPYLPQLNEYRNAMGTVYAGKAIHCGIVFPNGVFYKISD